MFGDAPLTYRMSIFTTTGRQRILTGIFSWEGGGVEDLAKKPTMLLRVPARTAINDS